MIPANATDQDLDNIIDKLVLNIDRETQEKREKEKQEHLELIRRNNEEEMKDIITEERLKDVEELRQLNKQSMRQFMPNQAATPSAPKSSKA